MRRFFLGVVIGALVGGVTTGWGTGLDKRALVPWVSNQVAFVTGEELHRSPVLTGSQLSLYQLMYALGTVDALFAVEGDIAYAMGNGHEFSEATDMVIYKLSAGLARLPDSVTKGQILDVALAYLRDHPDERHNSAAVLVWRALAEAEWR